MSTQRYSPEFKDEAVRQVIVAMVAVSPRIECASKLTRGAIDVFSTKASDSIGRTFIIRRQALQERGIIERRSVPSSVDTCCRSGRT
ncbi:MAG: hypothetical protein WED00_00145 [Aquisalimonadaceae bacterium]